MEGEGADHVGVQLGDDLGRVEVHRDVAEPHLAPVRGRRRHRGERGGSRRAGGAAALRARGVEAHILTTPLLTHRMTAHTAAHT